MPAPVAVAPSSPAEVLTADLGGTWMRAARLGPGALHGLRREPTPSDPAGFVALLAEVIAGGPRPTRAVVGVPGRVDHRRNRLEHAPNLPPAWVAALDGRALTAALGLPVHLANDADLAALGEWQAGAGRGCDDLVYVTLSTGVGAGVILGGRLLHGERSVAEVGHHVLDLDAFRRGEPATFEELASGTALRRHAAALGLDADGPTVLGLADAGDPRALAAWERVREAAVVGFRNLAFLYTPRRFVVGGGLGRVGERLWGPLREGLRRHGPPGLPEPIEVVGAALGDEAGLWGAGAWG